MLVSIDWSTPGKVKASALRNSSLQEACSNLAAFNVFVGQLDEIIDLVK